MFNLNSKLLSCLISLSASLAFADGAVSGGGGGTTIGEKADPEWIVREIADYSGIVITSWLNGENAKFQRLSEKDKQQSLFYKIFHNEKNIFEVIKNTKVEMRMEGPCYDKNGVEHDGSVISNFENGICLSPYLMAKKLNDRNYEVESTALLVHEFSHLMGADEKEATALQKDAIYSLMRVDGMDTYVKVKLLTDYMSTLGLLLFELRMWVNHLPANQYELEKLSDSLIRLRTEVADGPLENILFIDEHSHRLMTPYYVKLSAVRSYVCTGNTHEDQETRDYCAKGLKKGYGEKTRLSTGEYVSQRDDTDRGGSEYDEVMMTKISDTTIARNELAEIEKFLRGIYNDLKTLTDLKLDVTVIR